MGEMSEKRKLGVPVVVFYSYAHEDEKLREQLAEHLMMLRRSGMIREWYDRQILPGSDWGKEISENLESADIILVLISSDFLASEYCYDIEAKRALDRHAMGDAILIPIILRPVLWELSPFGKIQGLPLNAKPITMWKNRDLAFQNVCEGILRLITAHAAEVASKPPESGSLDDFVDLATPPAPVIEDIRILDAALPDHVTVGSAAVLAVMVRTDDSEGLKRIVEVNPAYGLDDDDIVSGGKFTLEFPVDKDGEAQPLDFSVHIEAPGFEPVVQTKSMTVEPDRDSDPRIFFLTPQKLGSLAVNIEVRNDDEDIVSSCFLRTTAISEAVSAASANLISVPLSTQPTAAAAIPEPQMTGSSQMSTGSHDASYDEAHDEASAAYDESPAYTSSPKGYPYDRNDDEKTAAGSPSQSYAQPSPQLTLPSAPHIPQYVPMDTNNVTLGVSPPSPRSPWMKVAVGVGAGLCVLMFAGAGLMVMMMGSMGTANANVASQNTTANARPSSTTGGSTNNTSADQEYAYDPSVVPQNSTANTVRPTFPSGGSANKTFSYETDVYDPSMDLQALHRAEMIYAKGPGVGGYATLEQLRVTGLIRDDALASGVKRGYRFTIRLFRAGRNPSFEITARPVASQLDRPTFVMNEAGEITRHEPPGK